MLANPFGRKNISETTQNSPIIESLEAKVRELEPENAQLREALTQKDVVIAQKDAEIARLRKELPRHLVITVHGIRTYGDWQERLERLLNTQAGGTIAVRNYHYGYFSVIAFCVPPIRWLVTRRFRIRLHEQSVEQKWERIDLVGHSFGTHMIAWGLLGINPPSRPKIHTIILAGSVLKSSFDWDELVPKYVGRVVNECGTKDSVLILNQIFVLFTGLAGRFGFTGMEGARLRNRYYAFGHSGYFLGKDGKKNDDFMRDRWLPLLTKDDPIEPHDERLPLTPLRGALEVIFRNFEPVKLTIYVVALLLIICWICTLYVHAKVGDEYRARLAAFGEFSNHVDLFARRAFMPNSNPSPIRNAIVTWGNYGNVSLWRLPNNAGVKSLPEISLVREINIAAQSALDDTDQGKDRTSFSSDMTVELGGIPITGLTGRVLGASFSHNGEWVTAWDDQGNVVFANVAEGNSSHVPAKLTGQIMDVKFQLDDQAFVILTDTSMLTICYMNDGKTFSKLPPTDVSSNFAEQIVLFTSENGRGINAQMYDGHVNYLNIP